MVAPDDHAAAEDLRRLVSASAVRVRPVSAATFERFVRTRFELVLAGRTSFEEAERVLGSR